MSRNPQLITVENFKFSIFDTAPKPSADTAFILFKEGGKSGHLLVITDQQPALSGTIRTGGFNKKAIVSLAVREMHASREVADGSGNFKFIVQADVSYRVRDAGYVFMHRIDIDAKVNGAIYEAIDGLHKKYEIDSYIDLERDLRKQAKERLAKLDYLEITSFSIHADVDERAKQIIDSNLDTMAGTVVKKNEGELASVEIEQRRQLEIQKLEAERQIKIKNLEAEREIEAKKSAVNLEAVKGMKAVKEEVGDDFGLYLAYAKGEISSVELEERTKNNSNAAMMAKFAALKNIVELDVLPGPALEQAALKLLGEEPDNAVTEQPAELPGDTNADEIIYEDAEEY